MTGDGFFARPEFLWWLLLVPAVGLTLWWCDRLAARKLSRLLAGRVGGLVPGHRPKGARLARRLFLSALIFAVLAAAQPRWGEGDRRVEERGIDIVLCLDVSRSMLARDLAGSRLDRAKAEIRALAARVEGDRIGLVLFAGEARLFVPLTRDTGSLAELAMQADPLAVPLGGTDLGAALLAALGALPEKTGQHEVVLLLTDGDDLEGRGLSVARAFRERGITVHAVGFGSPLGAKIPIEGPGGETFLKDRSGREVVSSMDEESLRAIAELTGGEFIEVARESLTDLYEDRIRKMARETFLAEERRERKNRFQVPLLAAFLLLMVEMLWCGRRRS
jgi:Ca-activated chloride channel homolog